MVAVTDLRSGVDDAVAASKSAVLITLVDPGKYGGIQYMKVDMLASKSMLNIKFSNNHYRYLAFIMVPLLLFNYDKGFNDPYYIIISIIMHALII